MATMMLSTVQKTAPAIRWADVESRLDTELQKIADESAVLELPEWEPLLDSKRVVGTVIALEDLFPFKIPPDKVVRKGGYNSKEDAKKDILERLKEMSTERSKPKVRK